MNENPRPLMAFVFGLICALNGMVLLLAALGVWRPSLAWAVLSTLAATGVALMAGGVPDAGRRRWGRS
ncbi:hypothetical protein FHR83_009236 [Actinoplanes campanulatus]|uniref:Uncharacterized protein n=1 Tax=Actinoplanes campanulatus TaxID=113559 RepID=A0A7W5ASB2_9ACTN|nr:hypothetical protein [Actinoplanes campanulatus]MBB3101507.1 hypothetical protein [Actinoplanes campanulatus]GGN50526.1 hypothetical protein GCM10010109_89750 [Actinoplanes campanulatus]GID42103.1 hypothetical protein Aca09nite_86090 [Actinoplanes campanulatus]